MGKLTIERDNKSYLFEEIISEAELCERVKEYANHECNYENRIQQWDNLLEHTIQTWKTRYNRYKMEVL